MEPSVIIDQQESILGKIRDIAQPLSDRFGIKTFAYRRFLTDGRSFGVSTNDEWNKWHTNYLLQQNNIKAYEDEVKETSKSEKGKFSWLRIGSPPDDELCSNLYSHNIWNTLCLYKRDANYVEGFYFATTRENEGFYNVALNKLAEFEKYSAYFKEKFLTATDLHIIDKMSLPTVSKESFNQFLEVPKGRIVLHKENELILLTKRETECLYYIAQGRSFKEVAKVLMISPRTVEYYLNNIKDKTGTYKKSELIEFYKSNYIKQLTQKYNTNPSRNIIV